jgi:hypothetical protein
MVNGPCAHFVGSLAANDVAESRSQMKTRPAVAADGAAHVDGKRRVKNFRPVAPQRQRLMMARSGTFNRIYGLGLTQSEPAKKGS